MPDKPYSPRLGGRYEIDKDTGKRIRVEETGETSKSAPQKPAPAKSEKTSAKPRNED